MQFMSIKRRSPATGRSSRKVSSSTTWQRVEIVPAKKMVPGLEYVGWQCANGSCGLFIAIAEIAAADAAASNPTPILQEPDFMAVVTCPHCQGEDLYRWNARKRGPYVPK